MIRAILLFSVLAFSAYAQDWARQQLDQSPRHREWITVQHDGRSVQTLVVYPESSKKTPVVLMIHEIFGMTDWAESLADQVAAAGYIAVAPDLLSGMGPNGGRSSSFPSQDARIEAVSHLNPDQITADLNAVADRALRFPSANGELFVAGFCWGGSQSFRFATDRPDLRAAFVFYGSPPPKDAMARIKAPVYGFYAGNDERVGATIPKAREDMKALGKTYEPVVYKGAGHGFMRLGQNLKGDEPNHAANVKARNEAWARWKKLLKNRE
ncbi:MAG TPA: dienelactone hydrolase family protein [Bryobacteraceae bacterium]